MAQNTQIVELQLALGHVRSRVQVLTQMARLGIMASGDRETTIAGLRGELARLQAAVTALSAGSATGRPVC